MENKIIILDGATVNPGDLSWKSIEELGYLQVYDRTPADKIIERIGEANIVLVNKTPIRSHTIEQCPKLKFIGVFATGYNIIDVEAAKMRGVLVANVPDYSTDTVAQFVFSLLLALCHRVEHHSSLVHAGQWTAANDFCFWDTPQIELAGKTFGVIGFGHIGAKVTQIAQAFGMDVIVHSRTPKSTIPEFVSLDTLLSSADIISIHCPLSDSTKNLINKTALQKMKASAFLINSSRGSIVNEEDLRHALNHGVIAGYAADVAAKEPIPSNSPLLKAKNCIITPHMAWAAKETRLRLLSSMAGNIHSYLKGNPSNIV